jgi:hypothetical protein
MVRAKFTVTSVTKTYYMGKENGGVTIKMQPQYDTTIEEDKRFSKATPSGEITMFVDNPPASNFLIEGGVFYVDFTPVPKPETVTA